MLDSHFSVEDMGTFCLFSFQKLGVHIRGFEKFFMEGAYSRCQTFATKVNYFNIFDINFDSRDEKIA